MLRIYLSGEVMLESGTTLVRERELPGRQGRHALAMLAAEHHRAVSRDELVDDLWGEEPPPSYEQALRALLSKLRRPLGKVGLEPDDLASGVGAYQLKLPADAWVDVEAAADAVHRAESDLRSGDLTSATGWELVTRSITGHPFLPGDEGPWVTRMRERLLDLRLRAYDVLVGVSIANGHPEVAIEGAEESLRLDPFRESSTRALMRASIAMGNRAKALQAYESCRHLLADDLGTSPSPETETLYLEILRDQGDET